MIARVSRPTRSLVRLASGLTMLCLTASLSAAAESQPRWVTNEAEWFGEVASCFGFSVSETARRWRRLQAAAESSTLTGPDLRRLFATLAFLTQHAQSTPADAATALQIFETGFIQEHLTTWDVRTLNVALPGARALMAQGFGGTPQQLESAADMRVLFTSVAAVALDSQVGKLVTTQGQGSAPCGLWSGSTPSLPPAPTHRSQKGRKGIRGIPVAELDSLKKWIGKYPFDRGHGDDLGKYRPPAKNFFEVPQIRKPLMQLLEKEDFEKLKKDEWVTPLIELIADYLTLYMCRPHFCDTRGVLLAINLHTGSMHVVFCDEDEKYRGETRWFSTDNNYLELPKEILNRSCVRQ